MRTLPLALLDPQFVPPILISAFIAVGPLCRLAILPAVGPRGATTADYLCAAAVLVWTCVSAFLVRVQRSLAGCGSAGSLLDGSVHCCKFVHDAAGRTRPALTCRAVTDCLRRCAQLAPRALLLPGWDLACQIYTYTLLSFAYPDLPFAPHAHLPPGLTLPGAAGTDYPIPVGWLTLTANAKTTLGRWTYTAVPSTRAYTGRPLDWFGTRYRLPHATRLRIPHTCAGLLELCLLDLRFVDTAAEPACR